MEREDTDDTAAGPGLEVLAGLAGEEITGAVAAVWASLARPGRWLTSGQRVALASECRAAADARRGSDASIDDAHRDLVATLVHDPSALHDVELTTVLGPATVIDEYVEVCAVVAKVIAVDLLFRGLGLDPLPLPDPGEGEPRRVRPTAAADLGARVPMLGAEDLAAEVGPGIYHVNVRRGHSLVPEEAALQVRLVEALYVPDLLAHGLEGRRGLGRDQIEAIATRVSSLNRCYYCTAGHAELLAMTADGDHHPDLVAAAAGIGDAGVEHGGELMDLAEGMVRGRPPLEDARARAAAVLDQEQLVGAIATVAAFVLLNRVSDSSGIPLDDMAEGLLAGVPDEVGLGLLPGAPDGPVTPPTS